MTAAIADAVAAAAVFNKLIKVYNTVWRVYYRQVRKEYPYCSHLAWLTDSICTKLRKSAR